MDIRMDEKTREKLSGLFNEERQDKENKIREHKKILDEHREKMHFHNVDELIEYMKSGHKVFFDKNIYPYSHIHHFEYFMDTVEAHLSEGDGVILCLDEEDFKNDFQFALIPYNGYIEMFHRES